MAAHMEVLRQAHFLAHLVASQTIMRREEGCWLRPDEMTEAVFSWQRRQATIAHWRTRVAIASHSERIATQLVARLECWSTPDLIAGTRLKGNQTTACFEQLVALCKERLPDPDGRIDRRWAG